RSAKQREWRSVGDLTFGSYTGKASDRKGASGTDKPIVKTRESPGDRRRLRIDAHVTDASWHSEVDGVARDRTDCRAVIDRVGCTRLRERADHRDPRDGPSHKTDYVVH